VAQNRSGFTLTEVIVVTIIVAIIAATAIPSMIGFIRHGQQINRQNIARTLYLSMQNQLSRASIEDNLRSILTEDFYLKTTDNASSNFLIGDMDNEDIVIPSNINTTGVTLPAGTGLLSKQPGMTFPPEDIQNEYNVYYITKPIGFVHDPNSDSVQNKFYRLLDEIIIDKTILDGAIQMEVNVRTGVIMSIFYSDRLSAMPANGFDYLGTGDARDNISGARGMGADGYSQDYARRQGYYGVNTTNIPQLPHMDIVNIYDGMDYVDPAGYEDDDDIGKEYGVGLVTDEGAKINILFAEFLVGPDWKQPGRERNFELFRDSGNTGGSWTQITISNAPQNVEQVYTDDFRHMIGITANSTEYVYYHADSVTETVHGISVPYERFIWVIDYIEGDLIAGQPHSIYNRNNISAIGKDVPTNIRARIISGNNSTITSPMFANSHFAAKLNNDTYSISSTRHLNNIRSLYDVDSNHNLKFTQIADIDIATIANPTNNIYNFKPISLVGGSYNAIKDSDSQFTIKNLLINSSDDRNVGLFTEISGSSNVTGVSLVGATINAPNAKNVGAIAGVLNDSVISRSNSYANVTGGSTEESNTGGLVGYMEGVASGNGGTLSHSFNAGFFDTQKEPETVNGNPVSATETIYPGNYGSVRAQGGNIGGLVGAVDRGTVQLCYNNARVNIENVTQRPEGPYFESAIVIKTTDLTTGIETSLGGLAGSLNEFGFIRNSYATNNVAEYEGALNVYSGGIAGSNHNPAPYPVRNVHYLSNGCPDFGNTERSYAFARSKQELWNEQTLGSGINEVSFISDSGAYGRYIDETDPVQMPKNVYYRYPYPVLQNNRPYTFDENLDTIGWEDIDIIVVSPVALVYFERYNDGTIRFGSGGKTQYNLDESNSLQVWEAGYMLLINPTDVASFASVELWVGTTPGIYTNSVDIEVSAFTEVTGNMPAGYEDYHYITLSLSELEGYLASTKNIPLNFAVTFGGSPAIREPELAGYFHPLFANSVTPTTVRNTSNFEVRTPWQMQNIDKLSVSDLVIPPETSETYADTGVIAHPGQGSYNGILTNQGSPDIPVTSRIDIVRTRAQAGPVSERQTFPTGTTINAATLNSTTKTIYLSGNNSDYTLVGDFTGIDVYHTGNGALNLGTTTIPIVIRNPEKTPYEDSLSYIYANNINVNVVNGTVLENVHIAVAQNRTITFISTPANGAGSTVRMNAAFYAGDINNSVIAASNWDSNLLPQFYTYRDLTITMTGAPVMSGVFYAHSNQHVRVTLTPGTSFNGLFYNRTSQGELVITPGVDIYICPNLPLRGLDPIVQAFLEGRGWEFKEGGRTPGDTDFVYTQTRNINFDLDRNTTTGIYGADGTTPLYTGRTAVAEEDFYGKYDGKGNEIRSLLLNGGGTVPYGIFATNNGTIENVILRNSEINGGTGSVGGIAGINNGTISLCMLDENVRIIGSGTTGGIAGRNNSRIERSGVVDSSVSGSTTLNTTGGITGANYGRVEDAYFLSVNLPNNSPVSSGGGGIVGFNNNTAPNLGTVTRAFYIAPAPTFTTDGTTVMYPIVRAGAPAQLTTTGDPTCFYVYGFRHRVSTGTNVPTWTDGHYNVQTNTINLSGGGLELITAFFDAEWLNFIYNLNLDFINVWQQPARGYPYPILRGLPIPTRWVETDGPERPEQATREDWLPHEPTSDRALAPNFVNANFSDPILHKLEVDQFYTSTYIANAQLMVANPFPAANRLGAAALPNPEPLYRVNMPNTRWSTYHFFSIDMNSINGWLTRPIPGRYSLFSPSDPPLATPANDRYYFPSQLDSGTNLYNNFPWGVVPNTAANAARRTPTLTGITGDAWTFHIENRSTLPRWPLIEFQVPNGNASWMRTNHLGQNRTNAAITSTGGIGTGSGNTDVSATTLRNLNRGLINAHYESIVTENAANRYAELNAESEGTIFQIVSTSPNSEFFYSFYHATNSYPGTGSPGGVAPPLSGDRLSFYLTPYNPDATVPGVEDNVRIVADAVHAAMRDNAMIMIRPAMSQRSPPITAAGVALTAATLNAQANMGTTTTWTLNPSAWNTIGYGASNQTRVTTPATSTVSSGPYDLSYHRTNDLEYLQPQTLADIAAGITRTRKQDNIPLNHHTTGTPIYLYDVWVDTRDGITTVTASTFNDPTNNLVTANSNVSPTTGDRTGYGITFWTTYNLTAGGMGAQGTTLSNAASSATNIHINGITLAQLSGTAPGATWPWLNDARNNVIGYWSVSHGWKHYHGEYTVPEGQILTEFAYQSNSGPARIMNGNLIDSVQFRSPAFLTINKLIKNETGTNVVTSVGMGDTLTVELTIKNWGEVPADRITIKDQLAPFTEYIEYQSGTVRINGALPPAGTNVSYVNDTIIIDLPATREQRLTDSDLIVTFQVRVRNYVFRNGAEQTGIKTLLYLFENQAVVEYHQARSSNLTAYTDRLHWNASDITEVYINPIELNKTVGPVKVNGPFNVTLTVTNTQGAGANFEARGMISELIPASFRLTQVGAYTITDFGVGTTDYGENIRVIRNSDGTTTLQIMNVNLNNTVTAPLTYTYTLVYTGSDYGVTYIYQSDEDRSSVYRYMYTEAEDVPDRIVGLMSSMNFPQPVVGISIGARDFSFAVSGTTPANRNIIPGIDLLAGMADEDSNVFPEVVFTTDGAGGAPLTVAGSPFMIGGHSLTYTVSGNDQQLDGTFFTAVLDTRNGWLIFTPKAGASGVYTLSFQIYLRATTQSGEVFMLSSAVRTITIFAMGDNTEMLVYYEQYGDKDSEHYGFYTAGGAVDILSYDLSYNITDYGYGILSPLTGYQTTPALKDTTQMDTLQLYILDVPPVSDYSLIPIQFGPIGTLETIGYIHPNFAKQVYGITPPGSATGPFSIRMPSHMQNIGLVNSSGQTFNLERNLDFEDDNNSRGLNEAGAVVTGEFRGIFNGQISGVNGIISNVTIITDPEDPLSNVGLFSQNSGIIDGITLQPVTRIIGNDNVGGIVGHNLPGVPGGRITNCIVEGDSSGAGMTITGAGVNVGGIAGLNDGTITNCIVRNTSSTITGNNYVGGIAGRNSATGIITGVGPPPGPPYTVYNVTLRTVNVGEEPTVIEAGRNVGAITGGNLNLSPSSITNTSSSNVKTFVNGVEFITKDIGDGTLIQASMLMLQLCFECFKDPCECPCEDCDEYPCVCPCCEEYPDCECPCEDCEEYPCICPCEDCGLHPCECPCCEDYPLCECPCVECEEYPCICPCEDCNEHPCECPCCGDYPLCDCICEECEEYPCECSPEPQLCPGECGELEDDCTCPVEPDEQGTSLDDTSSDTLDEADEGSIATMSGIIMLPIFGIRISRTKFFKDFMSKSSARAVRKINEHNDKLRMK